ncbi:MAG: HK97 family phage prohead protease [Planctomycetia bacterium]|nr:HK97 family phage prohead protease [Planctomycetia bacterium]
MEKLYYNSAPETRGISPKARPAGEPEGELRPMTLDGLATCYDVMIPRTKHQLLFRKGAFAECLRSKRCDAVALLQHESDKLLGRQSAETLKLWESSQGLCCSIKLPNTAIGRDTWTSVERGDLRQMSIGFDFLEDSWEVVNGKSTRVISRAWIDEVSLVTWPACRETYVRPARRTTLAMARATIAKLTGKVYAPSKPTNTAKSQAIYRRAPVSVPFFG